MRDNNNYTMAQTFNFETQAGFQSKRMNHGKTRGWIVRERGLEEVNANRNIEGRG